VPSTTCAFRAGPAIRSAAPRRRGRWPRGGQARTQRRSRAAPRRGGQQHEADRCDRVRRHAEHTTEQRPALTAGRDPERESCREREHGQRADLPRRDGADLVPQQADRAQDRGVAAPPAARHHDELRQHPKADDGEQAAEHLRRGVDAGVVGDAVRLLAHDHAGGLLHRGSAGPGQEPRVGGLCTRRARGGRERRTARDASEERDHQPGSPVRRQPVRSQPHDRAHGHGSAGRVAAFCHISEHYANLPPGTPCCSHA